VNWKRIVAIVLGVAVIAVVFAYALPKIADYGAVWGVVKKLDTRQILALLAATALNLSTFPPPQMAALPGLSYWRAFVITQTSTASTYVVPGGAAVGMGVSWAMLRGWGFDPAAVTLAVTVTGVWNQLASLGFPAVALALLTVTGGSTVALKTAALIGLTIFVVAAGAFAAGLSSASLARRIGDLAARVVSWARGCIRRDPVTWTGEALVRFRSRTIDLLRRRWWMLTLATLAGQLTVFIVLLVTLRTLGITGSEVSLAEAFAAWSLVRLLGSIPITPGGLGVVELGLTGALIGFGGKKADVVAAVLVYRFLTVVPTLVLGLALGATWRRQRPAGLSSEG
jgi:putative heme transporter